MCEDAWKCTNDMLDQEFLYLGGGCKRNDFDDDVSYACKTYDDGPGEQTRQLEIYQGDWYSLIESGDTVNEVRTKITDEIKKTNNNCNQANVQIFGQMNVNPGDTVSPAGFVTTPCLSSADEKMLTYVVYQNKEVGNSEVRLKARWMWDCTSSMVNDFFPDLEAEYQVYDNFGNIELVRFSSALYGVIEEGTHTTQFKYIFDGCEDPAQVQNIDRQLCARECDPTSWTCPTSAKKDGCVMNGVAMAPCSGSTTIPAGGETVILDQYGTIPMGPSYEFQMRLDDTTVLFGPGLGMTKTSTQDLEIFEFCADDSTARRGADVSKTTSTSGSKDSKKSGGKLADSCAPIAHYVPIFLNSRQCPANAICHLLFFSLIHAGSNKSNKSKRALASFRGKIQEKNEFFP